jgi:murein DD-endopeptidase MepM/ murein hydrolase activator NlpD
MPEAKKSGNSQTMGLLEGYLNVNPTSIGGAFVAIVDGTALSSLGDGGEAFADPGHSGTGQISIYTVREGDTLGKIAEMFGVSGNTITWANDLKSQTLKVGQELVILPISGVRHTVKSGDTLQTISKKYKADLDDILSYNNMPANAKLAVGDTIIIPDGVLSGSASTVSSGSSGQIVSSGYYIRPIRGGVKSQGIHGYNGIDLAASVGTPIMASADGQVILARTAGYNGGYGLYVVVKHANGTQTLYAHMSQVNVAVGEIVKQGEVIGAVGNTGRSTGPHLHFEVRGARNPF